MRKRGKSIRRGVGTAVVGVLFASVIVGCDSGSSAGLSASRGAGIYLKSCANCHGSDERSALAAVPPLEGSNRIAGPPSPLVAILLDGLNGPVTVRGERYRGIMPAWRDVLDDSQIADVLNYLRQQAGMAEGMILPEMVAVLRESTEHRHKFWTEIELQNGLPTMTTAE